MVSWAHPSILTAWKMMVQQAPSQSPIRVTFFSSSPAHFQVRLCHQRKSGPPTCSPALQATPLPLATGSQVEWAPPKGIWLALHCPPTWALSQPLEAACQGGTCVHMGWGHGAPRSFLHCL